MTQGLIISALGLGLTFAALALFILAMVVLQRLFPAPDEAPAVSPEAALAEPAAEAAVAAAIVVALSHLRELDLCRSGLGDALAAQRGAWWAARAPRGGGLAVRVKKIQSE